MKRWSRLTSALLVALLISSGSQAAEEDAAEAEAHSHAHHKNTVAGFVGITGEERRERALTLGIDYARRLNDRFSLGVGIERALGDLDFTIVSVPLYVHFGHWKWIVGPGGEWEDGAREHFLVRTGFEYAFEREGYEIVPKFLVDFVDGDTVIIGGVAVAWGF